MPNSTKELAAATVELMRDTSRRFSADLRDMSREMRQVGNMFKSSTTPNATRIDIPLPKLTLPSYSSSPAYSSLSPSGGDLDELLEDDEIGIWPNQGSASSSSRGSSSLLSRSPKTEEILKSFEEALRKTDRALCDMLGVGSKDPTASEKHPPGKIVAPPPSPANFFNPKK